MSSVNKVFLLGNVGRDPKVSSTNVGDAVVNMSLATSRKYKDKAGALHEETEWHNVVAFGRIADVVAKYVKKGSKLFVEGRLRTRKWQDKTGTVQYTTEVLADSVQLLGAHERIGESTKTKRHGVNDDDMPF